MPPEKPTPAIFTARSRTSFGSPSRYSFEQSSAAAAPSPIGAHMARVSGNDTGRSSITDCGVIWKRYCAFSFSAP